MRCAVALLMLTLCCYWPRKATQTSSNFNSSRAAKARDVDSDADASRGSRATSTHRERERDPSTKLKPAAATTTTSTWSEFHAMHCHAIHNTCTLIHVHIHTRTGSHTHAHLQAVVFANFFLLLFICFVCLRLRSLSLTECKVLALSPLLLLCALSTCQCQWGPPHRSSSVVDVVAVVVVVVSVIVIVFLRSLRFISFRFCGLSARVCKKLFQSLCRCRCCRPQHTPASIFDVFYFFLRCFCFCVLYISFALSVAVAVAVDAAAAANVGGSAWLARIVFMGFLSVCKRFLHIFIFLAVFGAFRGARVAQYFQPKFFALKEIYIRLCILCSDSSLCLLSSTLACCCAL